MLQPRNASHLEAQQAVAQHVAVVTWQFGLVCRLATGQKCVGNLMICVE